jgi:hypothetical protein
VVKKPTQYSEIDQETEEENIVKPKEDDDTKSRIMN